MKKRPVFKPSQLEQGVVLHQHLAKTLDNINVKNVRKTRAEKSTDSSFKPDCERGLVLSAQQLIGIMWSLNFSIQTFDQKNSPKEKSEQVKF